MYTITDKTQEENTEILPFLEEYVQNPPISVIFPSTSAQFSFKHLQKITNLNNNKIRSQQWPNQIA